jgi:hypothetical protein
LFHIPILFRTGVILECLSKPDDHGFAGDPQLTRFFRHQE